MPLRPTTRDDKLTILFYLLNRQTGSIADCLRHIQGDKHGAGYTEEEAKGWIAFMQTELADTSWIVRRLCNVLEIDYNATLIMGVKRDAEKKKEYLERHPGANWV